MTVTAVGGAQVRDAMALVEDEARSAIRAIVAGATVPGAAMAEAAPTAAAAGERRQVRPRISCQWSVVSCQHLNILQQ